VLRISLSERQGSFDLHALSTPPAFILSQDQTLKKNNESQTDNLLSSNTMTCVKWRRMKSCLPRIKLRSNFCSGSQDQTLKKN